MPEKKETFASYCKAHGLTAKDGYLLFDADKVDYPILYRARELHRHAKDFKGDLPWKAKSGKADG